LNKRCRPHLKPTNKSHRTDETHIKVKGEDKYLDRAVDSTGQTIEFLLTAKRDAAGAKRFFRKALSSPGNGVPRVINVEADLAGERYGSLLTAWRTLQGIEAVHMIRKGRVRWVAKEDAIAQATFIAELFGIAAELRNRSNSPQRPSARVQPNFAMRP